MSILLILGTISNIQAVFYIAWYGFIRNIVPAAAGPLAPCRSAGVRQVARIHYLAGLDTGHGAIAYRARGGLRSEPDADTRRADSPFRRRAGRHLPAERYGGQPHRPQGGTPGPVPAALHRAGDRPSTGKPFRSAADCAIAVAHRHAARQPGPRPLPAIH